MPSLEDLQRLMHGRLSDEGIPAQAHIPSRRDPDRAALSFAQRLMWAHQQSVPDSTANNICLTFTYTGEVDPDALHRALQAVVRRHEVLRTTYHVGDDGEPFQHIHRDFPPAAQTFDLRQSSTAADNLATLVAASATEPFDLATESSLRLRFVHLPADSSGQPRLVLVIAMHHIVWDGMTLPVLARDVRRFYEAAIAEPGAEPSVEPLCPQVADVAEWEQDRFDTVDHGADIRFWEEQFGGGIDTRGLPFDRRPGQAIASERSARLDRTLSTPARAGLNALSAELRVPAFSVFLSAYYLALHQLTGRRELIVGTAVANREEPGLAALVGNFSNSIPLRLDAYGETVAELIRHIRTRTDAAFAHRTFPLEHITGIARRVSAHPHARPYESLVLFLEEKIGGIELPGVAMSWELAEKGALAIPLTLEVFRHPERTEVQYSYQVELFDEATIDGLHGHIDAMLTQMTASGDYAALLAGVGDV